MITFFWVYGKAVSTVSVCSVALTETYMAPELGDSKGVGFAQCG